jgi:EAL domain-containing protein (putative c-di-GMP-specific phosphodiesterase class I)
MTFNSTIGASARGMVFVSIHPCLITSSPDTQAEALAELLRTWGLPPEQVIVEISSDAIGDDITKRNWFEALFRHYRRYGLRVALAGLPVDHGTLERLWQLWPDIIKLNRTTVIRAETDIPWRRHLTRIIGLVRELYGIKFLAQGIADPQQADIARACGIELLQGPYYEFPWAPPRAIRSRAAYPPAGLTWAV